MRPYFLLCVLAGALCLLLQDAQLAVASDGKDSYRVGVVFSVTGRGSLLGDPEMKTVGMIADEVNRAGGINGRPLRIVSYDDKSDPEKCVQAVETLIRTDEVCAIVGPSLSGSSLAAVPLVQKEKVVMVSCAASWKIVTKNRFSGDQYDWVFKTAQSDSHAVQAIYGHMRAQGISRVAILSAETGFGDSGREELLRLASENGIRIVADERYTAREVDMSQELEAVRKQGPEAIVNWSIGPTQVVVVRKWSEAGMRDIALYQSHGFGSRENLDAAGEAAEGVLCPLGACNIPELLPDNHPQKEVVEGYIENYRELYNEPISSFGGHAWDAMHLVLDALRSVGSDRRAIREHLEQVRGFVGQHGIFAMSPQDHNGLGKDSFYMVEVRDGEWAMAE
jgi:branched-chain amino acid transport system substrate-binding protein